MPKKQVFTPQQKTGIDAAYETDAAVRRNTKPARPVKVKRDKPLQMMFSDEEKKFIDMEAARRGEKAGVTARRLLLEHYGRSVSDEEE
jgi:hypothetical protein